MGQVNIRHQVKLVHIGSCMGSKLIVAMEHITKPGVI